MTPIKNPLEGITQIIQKESPNNDTSLPAKNVQSLHAVSGQHRFEVLVKSTISFIKSIKTVHIVRPDTTSIFISSDGPNYFWRDNAGHKGSAEGYAGLHQLMDEVGDLSVEEYEFLKAHNV